METVLAVTEQLVESAARDTRTGYDVRDGDVADAARRALVAHRRQDASPLDLADPFAAEIAGGRRVSVQVSDGARRNPYMRVAPIGLHLRRGGHLIFSRAHLCDAWSPSLPCVSSWSCGVCSR